MIPAGFFPKLAFFDIDGTILGKSGELTPGTLQAISRLQSSGVKVALATGRPAFGAAAIARQLGIDCWSLFFSGSLISNPKSGEVLYEAGIPAVQIREVIKLCKELGLYLELYSSDNYFVESFGSATPKHTHYIGFDPGITKFEDLLGSKKIIKLLTIAEGSDQKKRQDILIKNLPDLTCMCSTGANHPEIVFNNITLQTANRIEGFHRIISAYDIEAKDVISFGDAKSDADFLRLSGLGVAMANGHTEAINAADIVTLTAEEDGVAEVIEQLFAKLPQNVLGSIK